MKTINLKHYYKHITIDTYIEIPEEIFEVFEEYRKTEQAYQRNRYRNNAHYSLDASDGVEYCALFRSLSPNEIYERKLTKQQLYNAIASLPDKQAKRIYSHYFLGISKISIAKTEAVSKATICQSINRALKNIEKYLKNFS